MILTRKQEEALKICVERYRNKEKYTCISGYAGTGKSTIIKFAIEALGINPAYVAYATYTGKAAQVLVNKGNRNALTLHKLLYKSYPRPDGTFYRKPVFSLDPNKIVVVDEISMVPKELIDLLFSYNVHVICCGDPFQLQPINKNEDNHLLDHPHIFLDEIMRQEAESEIIQLTMKIRNNEFIQPFCGHEVQILDKRELNTGMLMWADQILVATNKMRISINNQMRELLGRTRDTPEDGDKLICLRNYWEIYSNEEQNSLINGTIGYLRNGFQSIHHVPPQFEVGDIDVTYGDLILDDYDGFTSLPMDTHMIMTGEKCVDFKTAFKLDNNKTTSGIVPLEFTYGYAITTHKAQGSEFDKVLVIEESFPFASEEHARWLYTACTRASSRLVLLR